MAPAAEPSLLAKICYTVLMLLLALALGVVLATILAPPAQAAGVVLSDARPRAELVGVDVVQGGPLLGDLAAAVPEDDAGKWQVLLFSGPSCPLCEQLKADFKSQPPLRQLAAADGSGWAHLLIYEQASRSQAFRFADYQVTQTPTLVVTPPPKTKQVPYVQVFRREGYDGNAEQLARDVVDAIGAFMEVSAGGRNCCPTPNKPTPPPAVDPPARPPLFPNLRPDGGKLLPNFPPADALVKGFVLWKVWAEIKPLVLWGGGILLVIYLLSRSKAPAATPAAAGASLAVAAAPMAPAAAPANPRSPIPNAQAAVTAVTWTPSASVAQAVDQATAQVAGARDAVSEAGRQFDLAAAKLQQEMAALQTLRAQCPPAPAIDPPPAAS